MSKSLSNIALSFIGTDVSESLFGKDFVDDVVACSESVSLVIKELFPDFPIISYTPNLHDFLLKDKRFRQTLTPSKNCIVLSPTEEANIGHVGIFVSDKTIASNDSRTGLFEENYTWESWLRGFKIKKGLHTYLFEVV